jgi:hypothetical protein
MDMNIDLAGVSSAAEETKKILESFGLIRNIGEEKKKGEQQFRWYI